MSTAIQEPFSRESETPEERERIFDAFRRWGYLEANLDPLGESLRPSRHPDLRIEGPAADEARGYYAGSIGAEFMHIPKPERRQWIQERMETEVPLSRQESERILERLVRAELFESALQARYLGSKRFSMEGVTALVPLLDEMVAGAVQRGAVQAVLAMSHRGRLNVMVQIVGRAASEVFANFEDVDPRSVLGGGDVKYHIGSTGDYITPDGHSLHVHLVSNPSHLEAVDPVALGRTRAKQIRTVPYSACRAEAPAAEQESQRRILPIEIHGDGAFAGQGIWAETLNLSNLHGYYVGGALHVIANNLLGFTAEPWELHSSRFAADMAKRLPIPIFHVNGEDLEAVVRVARMAVEYRYTFGSDVVVDLIGYRRHGHSEIDDASITQPVLYAKIKAHAPLWQVYAGNAGLDGAPAEQTVQKIKAEYDAALKEAKKLETRPVLRSLPEYWDKYTGGPFKQEYEVQTGVSQPELQKLGVCLTRYPEGFHIHPKIKKLLEQRQEMAFGKRPVDYGMAEALAFGTLVQNGTPVRLSGQDSRRGTFNQRHAVLIDTENELEFVPLCNLNKDQARFEVYNSELSEAAVLGFEYGYSRDYPETLTLWEAQFGDFANGAQIIIDQFLVSSEDKWGLLSGLVMLLPHGHEGQGPEHSSARIERYLQLAANDNIQICQPSNAAQYFHLLRRQALSKWRKPLIVFTPKSMLRHPDASSPIADFSRAAFLRVVPDDEIHNADRVLLCSGKIGHELRGERKRLGDKRSAIFYLDQLYPFPEAELTAELRKHPNAREVVWVQEEPANQGALSFVIPKLRRLAKPLPVRSVKRTASASPATGSAKAHELEQKALLALAFAGA